MKLQQKEKNTASSKQMKYDHGGVSMVISRCPTTWNVLTSLFSNVNNSLCFLYVGMIPIKASINIHGLISRSKAVLTPQSSEQKTQTFSWPLLLLDFWQAVHRPGHSSQSRLFCFHPLDGDATVERFWISTFTFLCVFKPQKRRRHLKGKAHLIKYFVVINCEHCHGNRT